ncbi:MAG TPA: hypothetical protein VFD70_14975 [Anaerolineae bacterium]|nr:hypothetical protein [Anaerolineae bacterium]
MATDFIFEVRDYEGARVLLGTAEWKKKILSRAPIGHPEVADYLDEIQTTISDPDVVFESTKRADARLFYKLNAGKREYADKHLVIVVKYVEEQKERVGYVSTVYLARGLYARGRIVWQRKNLLNS